MRFNRKKWGARPARPGPGKLDRAKVDGIALHWPGHAKPLTSVEDVKAALRGWQDYHMDDRGWSDIAYQEAIDQAGNVYRLRGRRRQPGANGDTDTNTRYGALLLVVATGETPSKALIKATRRRIKRHRRLFPNSGAVVGHGDIRPDPTECPGARIRALINDGAFTPKGHRK